LNTETVDLWGPVKLESLILAQNERWRRA